MEARYDQRFRVQGERVARRTLARAKRRWRRYTKRNGCTFHSFLKEADTQLSVAGLRLLFLPARGERIGAAADALTELLRDQEGIHCKVNLRLEIGGSAGMMPAPPIPWSYWTIS